MNCLKHKTNIIKSFFFLLIGSIIAGCSSTIPVKVDFDRDYNFAALKTYVWLQPAGEEGIISLYEKRYMDAIDQEMKSKGFLKVNEKSASNFWLKIHTVVTNEKNVTHFYNTWGYYPYWYYPYYMGAGHNSTMHIRDQQRATLILDVIDSTKKQVVWQGSFVGKMKVYQDASIEEKSSQTNINTREMLKSFPPK
ncbi:MAG: DUF4136 domain-containing protein [Gammaproteobacteria bacterium]|nr:DUF4136 domain-containing protein [Gammaproteobacteria bacterium]MDH5630479.1 DUF4136 domain-containing protein [Gammaproteobacteria bacterium]